MEDGSTDDNKDGNYRTGIISIIAGMSAVVFYFYWCICYEETHE